MEHQPMKRWSTTFGVALLLMAFSAFAQPAQAQIESVVVRVDGMSCPFCAYGLEKKLKKIEGVRKLTINIDKGSAELLVEDSVSLNIAALRPAVRDAGFTPREIIITVNGTLSASGDMFSLTPTGSEARFSLTGGSAFLSFAKSTVASEATVRVVGSLEFIKAENGKDRQHYAIRAETFEVIE